MTSECSDGSCGALAALVPKCRPGIHTFHSGLDLLNYCCNPAPLLITPELDCYWITFARSERRQGSRDLWRV